MELLYLVIVLGSLKLRLQFVYLVLHIVYVKVFKGKGKFGKFSEFEVF